MADLRNAIDRLDARRIALESAREEFRSHWAEIRDLCATHRGRGLDGVSATEDDDGSKKGATIYDPTGIMALKTLASGMQSGITSKSRPWFRLGSEDQALADSHNVREWLFEVERRMRSVMAGSNFYNACYHTYAELGAFQTAAFAILEDYDTVINCVPYTIGEYCLACDHRGQVNTFVRRFFPTALQLVEEFGKDSVSAQVKAAAEGTTGTDTRFDVVHFIEPNDNRMELRDAMGRPWRSVYYEVGNHGGHPLRVSGFHEFPVMAPRWDVVGSAVYGTGGPGMDALPDVKGLQKMREKYYIGVDKRVETPLQGPADMRFEEVNDIPGGITYVNNVTNQWSGFRPLVEPPQDLSDVRQAINEDRATVNEHFYVDLFRMISSLPLRSGTTATEIAERHEEKLQILGPVLERIHTEMADRAIDRIFAIMDRAGLIPEPPAEIAGRPIRVEYISLLAQAQKLVGLGAIEGFIGFAGGLAAVKPDILDKVDLDEALDLYADALGTPPTIVVPGTRVAQIRQARAEQEQAQQLGDAAMVAAQGAETLSKADMGSDNALNALLGRSVN